MNRRRILALAGGAVTLAGCSAAGPNLPTDAPTTTPDEARVSDRLSFEGDLTEPFTADGPTTIELRCTSGWEVEVTATDTLGPVVPFAGRFGQHTSRDAQVLLHPDDVQDYWFQVDTNRLVPASEVLPETAADGCWRIPTEYDGIAVPPGRTSREIAAHGSVTHRYTLYHLHECIAGTYRFSQSVTLTADGFEVEEYVPLVLRVAVRDDGEVSLEVFGIREGYLS